MPEQKNFRDFLSFCKNKSFSLIGIGVSNAPLVPFLLECGAGKVVVRDLKKKPGDPAIIEAEERGAAVMLGETYLRDLNEDVIIRSPGVRPDLKEFSEAVGRGSRLTCETELFLEYCPSRRIAVTGSDGKTTTTTLIAKILEAANKRVVLGGNIGKALLPRLREMGGEDEFAVMELSSFQLMNCRFSPDVAVVTNLAENHLDWHRGMEEYLDAKKNVLRHQTPSGVAVLGWDNAITKTLSCNGIRRYFSLEGDSFPGDGVFCEDGVISVKTDGHVTPVLRREEILLPGDHNVWNYMAAIAATQDFVTPAAVRSVASTFGGVEHRIEFVRTLDGVRYFNSSIDSSPSRSTACLRSFSEKIVLIAGGYDKHLDYTAFGDEVCRHAKCVILCGQTSEKIENAVLHSPLYRPGEPGIRKTEDFHKAVLMAREAAKPGDTVVLSPASASFDLFRNFEERGKKFKEYVMEF